MGLFPRHLKMQIVTMVTTILLATGATIGWLNARRHSDFLEKSLQSNAKTMTLHYADRSAYYMVLGDFAGLESFLIRSAAHSDISQLQVCETNGFVLGSTKKHSNGKNEPVRDNEFIIPPLTFRETLVIQGNDLIIWQPISAGTPLGWLKARFNLESVKALQTEAWMEIFFVTQFWILCSALLLLLLLRPVVRDIGLLSKFARRLDEKKGEEVNIRVQTDEITELAASLNHASRRLFQTENQLVEEQERLRFSEEKYRRLIQKVKAAVIMYGTDGRILSGNVIARQMLGVSEKEMLQVTEDALGFKLLREDGSEIRYDSYPANLALTRNRYMDNRIIGIRRNDREDAVWALASTDSMKDDSGRVTEIILTLIDITDLKNAEDEITRHQRHLESLVHERTSELENATKLNRQYLDIAGVILVAINADQTVTMINSKGCDVLGAESHEIIGKNWFTTFIPERNREDVLTSFHKIITGEIAPVEYFENPVLTRDGKERLIAWHNSLVKDDKGKITGSLSSGEDITEQRRAEEQIQRLNEDLRKRAADLEEANRELESFAYTVSHDLRAPIRHIDGFVGLLEKKTGDKLDKEEAYYLQMVSQSARKMGELIDDLLSFSRMGRLAINLKKVDLDYMVHDIVRELRPDCRGRRIKWQIGRLPQVFGDYSMLRIVLINLISNAVKFTKNRKEAVIEAGCREDEKEVIVFIRDNGVGFDQVYAEKIFGVFQRMHQSDEFEGTGVGLAIAHRIIQRHGGNIWAEGKPDAGAIFYFSLSKVVKGEDAGERKFNQSNAHSSSL